MTQILLDAASPHVRLVLRIYFNVTLPLLGIIGDQCCRKQAQLRLFHKRALDITQTTGWLRGTSAAYAMYSMRRSPAGLLGVIMILAGILWLVADLVVTAQVVPINVVDRCPFNTSGNYGAMYNTSHAIGPLTPINVGGGLDLVTRARDVSKANGGLTGVFPKVNSDPTFRADTHDIMGRWECKVAGQDVTYPPNQNQTLMAEDLASEGLLYDFWVYTATDFIGVTYTQFLAWSSSIDNWSSSLAGHTPDEIIHSKELHLWDVRAAVDVSLNSTDDKVIRPYYCTIHAPNLDFVLGKVQAYSTMNVFISQAQAIVHEYFGDNIPFTTDPAVSIASILDVITMLSGMNFNGQNAVPFIKDQTQGCYATKTQIPALVLLVGIIVTAITIGIFAYWLYLIVAIRQIRSHDPGFATLVTRKPPNGLLGWMKQAIQEIDNGRPADYNSYKNWQLAPSQDLQSLHLTRKSTDSTEGQRTFGLQNLVATGAAHHYRPVMDEAYGYSSAGHHIPRKPVANVQVSTY